MDYKKEKKCPIYVHEFSKTSSINSYDTNSSKTMETATGTSKTSNSHSSKSVLDKLEETYWASWKPSKEKGSPRRRGTKNKAYGDTSDSLVKYFQKSNFKVDSTTEAESVVNQENQSSRSTRIIEMSTQEIQTDICNFDQTRDNYQQMLNKTSSDNDIIKESIIISPLDNKDDSDSVAIKEDNMSQLSSNSKLLQHKDSFIIHRKKQDEVKENFQQPKCIKLFKKPGSSYLRGGTYPLKSCLRSDNMTKGQFRLGPPGSAMFVTSNSFNRKYGK